MALFRQPALLMRPRHGRSKGALGALAAAVLAVVAVAAVVGRSGAAAWAAALRPSGGRAGEAPLTSGLRPGRRPLSVARPAAAVGAAGGGRVVVEAEEVGPRGAREDAVAGRAAEVLPGVGEEKVAIITGASTGIGLATAEGMAQSGRYRKIILAGRDEAKHAAAISGLQLRLNASSKVQLEYAELNLASLDSVRKFAEGFLATRSQLDTLVLNAGVMAIPDRRLTDDGYEYQFGVNHLGHFLLANLLLDTLVRSGTAADPSRVISLSSSAHQIPSPLLRGDLSDLQSTSYAPWVAYGQSKLANVLFVYELDRLCRQRGLPVSVNAVHPGVVDTELSRYLTGDIGDVRKQLKPFTQPLLSYVIKTPADGAKTSVLLATGPEGKLSGRYWQDERPAASMDLDPIGSLPGPFQALLGRSRPKLTSYEPETWEKLWKASQVLVRLEPNEVASIA